VASTQRLRLPLTAPGPKLGPIGTRCLLGAFPSKAMEDEMHSDRIALIAGIASLGLVASAAAPAPVQGPIAAHTAMSTPVPIGPIVDKKSASAGSKAANVFLLTGQ
jgi:hypothetical protein